MVERIADEFWPDHLFIGGDDDRPWMLWYADEPHPDWADFRRYTPASDYDQLLARNTALLASLEKEVERHRQTASMMLAKDSGTTLYITDAADRLSQLINEHGGGGSGSEKCERCGGSGAHSEWGDHSTIVREGTCPACHGSGTRAEGS